MAPVLFDKLTTAVTESRLAGLAKALSTKLPAVANNGNNIVILAVLQDLTVK